MMIKYFLQLHRRNNGQAMTEFCVAAPLLVLLLWSIWYVADMYIMKHKTLVAARYGTWFLARNDNLEGRRVTNEQLQTLIAHRFFSDEREGLRVENIENADDESGRFGQIVQEHASEGEWINEIIDSLGGYFVASDTPSVYALNVSHRFPTLFGAVDLRETYPHDYFFIQSEHYVVGNSWDGGRTDNHDIIGMIGEMADEILDDLDAIRTELEQLGNIF